MAMEHWNKQAEAALAKILGESAHEGVSEKQKRAFVYGFSEGWKAHSALIAETNALGSVPPEGLKEVSNEG
jgi:hypothetical protein